MVLSDLVDVIGGGTPKTTEESYWNGSIPWLSVKISAAIRNMCIIQKKYYCGRTK